jgi:hypothetical protein
VALVCLRRYYPPDFDPADVPRGKREKDNAMKVRMMLPMTVRCSTCGEFMYKGTKFNCKKEDVSGKTYLGLQIFRFYMRCRKCSAEITYTTNPQTMDYDVEHGTLTHPMRCLQRVNDGILVVLIVLTCGWGTAQRHRAWMQLP